MLLPKRTYNHLLLCGNTAYRGRDKRKSNDISLELFQTRNFDVDNLGLYIADTVIDICFSTLYLDKISKVSNVLLGTAVGGTIDAVVDIVQTCLLLSPQAQQRIRAKSNQPRNMFSIS